MKYLTAVGITALLALGGCWDSDDDAPANTTSVPDSAGASGAAFVNFLQSLSDADETSEPLAIPDSFAVPADETT
ncbi:MAG: hypothetical protein H7Z15_16075 [Rhizobacter sp.]|nr:hypothetical protein [Rhizobacter sp.]